MDWSVQYDQYVSPIYGTKNHGQKHTSFLDMISMGWNWALFSGKPQWTGHDFKSTYDLPVEKICLPRSPCPMAISSGNQNTKKNISSVGCFQEKGLGSVSVDTMKQWVFNGNQRKPLKEIGSIDSHWNYKKPRPHPSDGSGWVPQKAVAKFHRQI